MKKLFTLPNIYIILWGLYFTQGTFLPKGSIWSQLTLAAFLAISVYYIVLTFTKFKVNSYLKALVVLLLMFTLYGIFSPGNGVGYLKSIYISLMPPYAFFVFFKNKKIDLSWIHVVFFLLLAVVLVQYLASKRLNESLYVNAEERVVNVGYEILALLPMVWFWKKKPIIQYVLMAVIMAFVLSTVKRGAILIGVLCTVYILVVSLRSSSRKAKWYIWLLGVAFVVVAVRYAINVYQNSQLLQTRVENTLEGDSSYRNQLYKYAWDLFLNSNIVNALFGHGAEATWRLFGNAAHNDWLEILVNQGLLGVIVYLYYWVSFFKLYRKDKNIDTHQILGSLIIIYFMSTFFSMSYNAMTLPASVALGYCLANESNSIHQKQASK